MEEEKQKKTDKKKQKMRSAFGKQNKRFGRVYHLSKYFLVSSFKEKRNTLCLKVSVAILMGELSSLKIRLVNPARDAITDLKRDHIWVWSLTPASVMSSSVLFKDPAR